MIRTFLFLALLCSQTVHAAVPLTWDGDPLTSGLQDGAGEWNTSDTNRWFDPAALPPGYQVWNNAAGDIAVFGSGVGTAGNVALGTAITAGGLTFNAAGSGNYTLSGNVLTLVGSAAVTANVDATISSSLAGTVGMLKTGSGVLTLSGGTANTLTGLTLISGGTLTTSKTAGITAIAGNVEVALGGTFIWGANNQIADTSAILISGGSISFSGRTETIASYTQTSGGLINNNASNVTITGALTLSGGTPLTLNSNGRWSAKSVNLTGFTTAGNTILFGGDGLNFVTSLEIGSDGLTMTGQTIRLNRTITANALGNELILNGNVTASGTNNILSNNATAVLTSGAINRINLGDGIRTWNITDTTTVNILMMGTGGITKTGTGTLAIAGADSNAYSGLTTLSAGTLSLNKTVGLNAVGGNLLVNGGTLTWVASDQIPDTATITVTGGLTFIMAGRNEKFSNYVQTGGEGFSSSSNNTGEVEITGTATLSGGGPMTVNSNGKMTVNELIATGSSRVVVNIGGNGSVLTTFTIGSGGLNLSGQNVTINLATTDGRLGSELILNGGITATGTNNLNQGSGTFGVARVNLGSAIRAMAINGGQTTIHVPLIGSGGITKTGAGSLRLMAASTYTGKTTISGGTLALEAAGSIADSSWIQVDADGTFQFSSLTGGFNYSPTTGTRVISGSGSLIGNLTLGGVAQIRPGTTSDPLAIATAGDGAGQLSITGDLVFSPATPSTVAEFQIFDASTADQLSIAGALTLTASSFLKVTLDESYVPASGDFWELMEWSGLLNAGGFSLGDNNRNGSDLAGNEGNLDLPDLTPWGLLWDISPITSGGSLTIAIVPEPGRMILLALGMLGLAGRRRRA